MTTTRARRIANGIIGVTFALYIFTSVLGFLRADYSGNNSFDVIYTVLLLFVYGLYLWIGRLIVTRQPGNTVGWLLLAIPLIWAFAFANGSYATQTLVTSPGQFPFGRAAAWIDRWMIVPILSILIPLFLFYPNGRLPSRRWGPVLWLTVAAPIVTTIAFAVTPGQLTGGMADIQKAHVTNPLGIESAKGLIDALTQIGGFATLACGIAAIAAIFVRYRGADAEVRQQVRWLAFVAIAFVTELVIGIGGTALTNDNNTFGNVLFLIFFITLTLGTPIAFGIAILRYRLYDLDVVVRKTLVFGVLAAFITVVYAAVVGGIGAIVGTTSNTVLSFVAAVVLAVAFQPVRDRARRLADRLVYGKRATPYEVLTEFSGHVSESYATDDVLARMAQVLAAGTGADSAAVWLDISGELRPEAVFPADATTPTGFRVDVHHQGELLGALTLEMPASDPMNPAKERLVGDLASQAGLVLRNVKLIEELRASRQRLVAAQDEERRKLERNLHDGAQQQLVALSVKLRLAETMTERDPAAAKSMLSELQTDTSDALENLRDLARGIYPPLLADRGLPAALEAQVRKASVPTTLEADAVSRYPQDVEAAVYFCALEALNNVAKYANASRAVVALSQSNGTLRFEVRDDGAGFDAKAKAYGTGLQGMRDRLDAIGGSLDVTSAPGAGTVISGAVPVAQNAASEEGR